MWQRYMIEMRTWLCHHPTVAASASKVIRVYRIWSVNSNRTEVTGAITLMEIQMLVLRFGSGTAVNVTKMDSSAAALDASVYVEYDNGANLTAGNTVRREYQATDELTISGWVTQSLLKFYPLGLIWDAGYGDDNVQPLTLRQDEGVHVKNTGAATGGVFQFCMEFTQSAS